LSSSVTIDWRAVRERERQECLALRAELAQLKAREQQLRLRCEAVNAACGRLAVEIPRVGRASRHADSEELGRLAANARAALAGASAGLDREIDKAVRARTHAAATAPRWTTRAGTAETAALRSTPDIDLGALGGESGRSARAARMAPQPGAARAAEASAARAAEADAVIEECRLRCPDADLTELTGLRATFGVSPLGDRALIRGLRVRAARTIQRVKRENELEERRQRLFVLAEDASSGERAALRRRVADAPPENLPHLDGEVTAAVERASAERSKAEAVAALEHSLADLGYDVQGGFASLLPPGDQQPDARAAQQTADAGKAPRFVVAASPHSADHGLRVRVGRDQLYLSVVRRAGTAAEGDAVRADTAVQEQTCRDLVTVSAAAAEKGVQIIIGNAQAPGRPSPELAAEYWPAAAARERAGAAADERLRAWTALEQQRAAGQRAKPQRPGR